MTEDVLITVEIRMGNRPMRAIYRSAQVSAEPAELDQLFDAIISRLAVEIGADQ